MEKAEYVRKHKIIDPTIRFDWTRCENFSTIELFETFRRQALEQNCPPQVINKIFEVAFNYSNENDHQHFLQVLLDNTN